MSSVLIKSAKVIDSSSPFHGQKVDVLIEGGEITDISEQISHVADQTIDIPDLSISVGWMDMRAVLSEPGFEHRDDIHTLCASAAFGGFTDVAVLPNTQPVIQSKEAVKFIQQQNQFQSVDLHVIAAFTKDAEGQQMTEMMDLHHAGAVAFSDGLNATQSAGIMSLGLQYLQAVDGLIIQFPENTSISPNGQMHEGITSTMMGMKGLPAMAEEIAIMRDLSLLEYTGGKLHFSNISTAKAVDLIREAKEKGFQVTCDVAAHQLFFTDADMMAFDTNRKVKPPFRSEQDHQAIWQGLADGTIDAITSSHTPLDQECKQLEFDLADFGILGLETAFASINTKRKEQVSIEQLIEKLTTAPRNILQLPNPTIKKGEKAKLTLFNEEQQWVFAESDIQSKSRNTPFVGELFIGKALGIINGTKVNLS